MPSPDSLEIFAEKYALVGAANKRSLERLALVLKALEARSIDCLLLKGADLLTRVYSGMGLRQIGDFDLLVKEADLPRIDEALSALGYRQQIDGNPAYVDAEGESQVDLATEVWYLKDEAEIWRRAVSRPALGLTVRAMDATDALLFICLYVCLHRARFSAGFAQDIFLMAKNETINWDRLTTSAANLGLKAPLFHALGYALSKRAVPIPGSALSALAPSTFRERAQLFLLRRLVKEDRFLGLSHLLVLLSRPRGRRLASLRRSFSPSREFMRYRYGERSGASLTMIRAARPFYLAAQAAVLLARILKRVLLPAHASAR
jgi:hypothetical protein